jgi:hypothetical protein
VHAALIPLFLTALVNVRAPDAEGLRAQAEAAFGEGVQLASTKPGEARARFAAAARRYLDLHQASAANAALYRNLGNAYLLALDPDDKKADNLARAILAYRRGLDVDPTDHELRRSLDHARQQVYYPPPGTFGQPPVDHRPPWLPRWPGVLLGIAGGAYALAVLAAARWWMLRRPAWLNAAFVAGGVMLIALGGWALEYRQMAQEARAPVVIVARDGIQLLVGNGGRYPPRYETVVNRGVEARLRHQRGNWLQIELAGGQIGWVPREAVLMDEL